MKCTNHQTLLVALCELQQYLKEWVPFWNLWKRMELVPILRKCNGTEQVPNEMEQTTSLTKPFLENSATQWCQYIFSLYRVDFFLNDNLLYLAFLSITQFSRQAKKGLYKWQVSKYGIVDRPWLKGKHIKWCSLKIPGWIGTKKSQLMHVQHVWAHSGICLKLVPFSLWVSTFASSHANANSFGDSLSLLQLAVVHNIQRHRIT